MHSLLALTVQQPGGGNVNIGPVGGNLPTGGLNTLQTAIGGAFNLILIVAVLITLIMIAFSGLQWASADGDKQKIASARGRLTWAIVGLVIALVAIFLIRLIAYFFNITLF